MSFGFRIFTGVVLCGVALVLSSGAQAVDIEGMGTSRGNRAA